MPGDRLELKRDYYLHEGDVLRPGRSISVSTPLVPKGTSFVIKRVWVTWRHTYSISMYSIILEREGKRYYMASPAPGLIFNEGILILCKISRD